MQMLLGLYIQGHGSKDTFVDMFNQPIHMLKGAVFQNELFGRRKWYGWIC